MNGCREPNGTDFQTKDTHERFERKNLKKKKQKTQNGRRKEEERKRRRTGSQINGKSSAPSAVTRQQMMGGPAEGTIQHALPLSVAIDASGQATLTNIWNNGHIHITKKVAWSIGSGRRPSTDAFWIITIRKKRGEFFFGFRLNRFSKLNA